jgi:hypothetical protein
MQESYRRPKEPDPIIWNKSSPPSAGLSVASTTVTLYSPFKASYGDLRSLVQSEPLLLPSGALENNQGSRDEEDACDFGSRHGKYGSRSLSREFSFDGEASEVEPETAELYMRLLAEADRITSKTGCHSKVTKLTMSKTRPQKTFLRHTSD